MTQALRQPSPHQTVLPSALDQQDTLLPNGNWRTLDRSRQTPTPPKGLDALWHRGVGLVQQTVPRRRQLLRRARRVVALSGQVRGQSSTKLREQVESLQAVFRRGNEKRGDVDQALAVLRETARRELGLEPYPVQLAAALAGLQGCLVEMATGEGKTLSAAMTAAVAGWRGRGCHVLTVNDYLAGRDAEELLAFYRALNLRVAHIEQEMDAPQRRQAYHADVTYLTNKEAAADFLRDSLQAGRECDLSRVLLADLLGRGGGQGQIVQRGLEQAIVDEADSILIDEAVTPLIISSEAPLGLAQQDMEQAHELATKLEVGRHVKLQPRFRDLDLTPAGRRELARRCQGLEGIWKSRRIGQELVGRALSALHLFHRDQHYVVHEGKIVIVDESTGRLMPDRSWRDGLHQAVEIKEGVEVTPAKTTLARISFQRFFGKYRRLTGMTGTAREAAGELWQVYRLPTVRIPTHRPCIRTHLPDRVFATAQEKWKAIRQEIQEVHATGRPVLVGTRSVDASEHLSKLLAEAGLDHQVLSAVHHQEEAAVVAGAGQRGAITVATNMAGRGTDIKLGPGVADLGGLHVIASERHESARIDRQLIGRAARQGDPGTAVCFISREDELIHRWAGRRKTTRLGTLQARAQRLARRQRQQVLRQDVQLDEQLGFAGIEH